MLNLVKSSIYIDKFCFICYYSLLCSFIYNFYKYLKKGLKIMKERTTQVDELQQIYKNLLPVYDRDEVQKKIKNMEFMLIHTSCLESKKQPNKDFFGTIEGRLISIIPNNAPDVTKLLPLGLTILIAFYNGGQLGLSQELILERLIEGYAGYKWDHIKKFEDYVKEKSKFFEEIQKVLDNVKHLVSLIADFETKQNKYERVDGDKFIGWYNDFSKEHLAPLAIPSF
jgi:hypothetical protein